MTRSTALYALLATAFAALIGVFVWQVAFTAPATAPRGTSVRVVAAENTWGSLAQTIGGTHVQVSSILTDPNADPHTFEANPQVARSLAQAQLVITNGAGYDTWAQQLLSASPSSARAVLTAATVVGAGTNANPHFWYDPTDVEKMVQAITHALSVQDPANAAAFAANAKTLETQLQPYRATLATIRAQYGGTPIAATEDLATYLASSTALRIVSPSAFTHAVAQGITPPAQSVATFENQLRQHTPRVLIYNTQTITPLTAHLRALAQANGIPVVGVSETISPARDSFAMWMQAQAIALKTALARAASSTTAP